MGEAKRRGTKKQRVAKAKALKRAIRQQEIIKEAAIVAAEQKRWLSLSPEEQQKELTLKEAKRQDDFAMKRFIMNSVYNNDLWTIRKNMY